MAFSWKLEGRIFSHQLKAPGFVLWGSSGTRKTLIQMGESDKISRVLPLPLHREWFWRAEGRWHRAAEHSRDQGSRLGQQGSAGCSLPSRTKMGFSTSKHSGEPRWRITAHAESQGSELCCTLERGQEGLDHTSQTKACQKVTCPCTAGLERHGRRDGKTRGVNKGGVRLLPA